MPDTASPILYPFTFHPSFKERIWGGRKLEQLYRKPLPPETPIGESWEISDRPGDVSVVANGPLAGKDLHWVIQHYGRQFLGSASLANGRFPLLVKILDAREKLSLQVHPPPSKASEFGGEPKTEMWYVADAAPGAELYVGLKRRVTREDFERRIQSGTVAECFHCVKVSPGDTMFLPSGRVHAIGSGLVIFEIQQNSDTTYRVYDWDRLGTDGKPRALHIAQSLASIDFQDYEPSLISGSSSKADAACIRPLVKDSLFTVDACQVLAGSGHLLPSSRLQIIGLLTGNVRIWSGQTVLSLIPGQFCLVPACLSKVIVKSEMNSSFLRIEPGQGSSQHPG